MLCFYHNDMDGLFSAGCVAVFRDKFLGSWIDGTNRFEYIPIDYQDRFPLDKILPGEEIYIVDFSLSPEMMKAVWGITKNLTWIDHHQSTIERCAEFPELQKIPGIRDTSHAGCMLCFKWFTHEPSENAPTAIKLVEDRDIWKWEYGDTTRFFHAGCLSFSLTPESAVIVCLLKDMDIIHQDVINRGRTVESYREQWAENFCKSFWFDTIWEGYRCICLNAAHWGSEIFCGREKEYDIAVMYIHLGDRWRVSLYSKTVDVKKIAMKYGGGGHPGASGFVVDSLPFKKISHA